MIIGIGVDLVSTERIKRICEKYRHRFVNRIFSSREIALNNISPDSPSPFIAARFAAKEAVLKAIGCGIGPASFNEVQIISKRGSQPKVVLRGEALKLAEKAGITNIVLSISHEPPFACAISAVYKY